jgi:AcrR family transcriptional regulator
MATRGNQAGDLRSDARRNRDALVAAATAVFGEQGLQAPLDEIARRAGVGNATLYRRFPTRHSLLAAVFAERLTRLADAIAGALADPDPWNGFTTYVTLMCQLQAADRGLADLLVMNLGEEPEIERLRQRAYRDALALIEHAQAAGRLRPDFRHEDLVVLLMANAGLVHRTAAHAPGAWRRHLAFVLDGLGVTPATPAPPSEGPAAIARSMREQAAALGCTGR